MKFLHFLDKQLEKYLMLWLYAFIVIVIFVEVLRRFLLDYSSLWGEEATRYAFIYLTWIGAAAAVKSNSHIRIDLLINKLSNRGVALLNILTGFCCIVFSIFAIYLSWNSVYVSFNYSSVTDGLRIVKAWFLFSVPFGFSLVFIRSLEMVIKSTKDFIHNTSTIPNAKLFD